MNRFPANRRWRYFQAEVAIALMVMLQEPIRTLLFLRGASTGHHHKAYKFAGLIKPEEAAPVGRFECFHRYWFGSWQLPQSSQQRWKAMCGDAGVIRALLPKLIYPQPLRGWRAV